MSEDKPTIPRPEFAEENLVYQSEHFTIWLSENLDVWWHTEASFNPTLDTLQKQSDWAEIMTMQAELEALPMSHLSDELKRGFRFQVATAILLLFKEKLEEAKKAMQAAEAFYRARTAERARIWMLQSGALSVLLVTAPLLLSNWIGKLLIQPESLLEQIMLGALAGAYGAFTSLILRVSVLGVDATAGRTLHFTESACRVFVGFVAGGIAICAIAAGVITPGLLKVGPPMLVVVGFTFGFSERALPTLVGKVDTRLSSGTQPVGRRNK